ncbi:MAG: LysR family transcriptional regulator [Alphaproteobacteria bacterium]|nr:LysR family transcriptional regulator [Alphaproteobacteria bacterium]
MIEKLEIKHLRTLNALYKFNNMSLAAEYLNVSQQAISLQLSKMRDILADELFVRAAHGMTPTPYAKQLESHIQKILISLQEIPLSNSTKPNQVERTLVISATDYTQKVIIGELIKDLRLSAPKVKILVIDIESTSLTQKMHRGEIDLAFTTSAFVPVGLETEPLFVEKYQLVSANKALISKDKLSIEQLVKQDFIIINPGVANLKGSADTWFEKQGLSRNVAVSVPSFFMAQQYLKTSNMVAFIPSRLLPSDGLFNIPLTKYPPGYQVVAAYHPSAKSDPFIIWLLNQIQSLVSVTSSP